MGVKTSTLEGNEELKEMYVNVCKVMPDDCKVIVQNVCTVEPFGELFHALVMINGSVQLKGLLDTRSMVCTLRKQSTDSYQRPHWLTGRSQQSASSLSAVEEYR